MLGAALAITLVLAEASEGPVWRPGRGGRDEARAEERAQTIIRESILGSDLEPWLDALPPRFARSRSAELRDRLAERQTELRRRLGKVSEWEVTEVLRDDRGRIKVKASFFASPARAGRKRSYRGISFVFYRSGGDWRVTWMGFWDPDTGSWDVLSGETVSRREILGAQNG